MLRAWYGQQAWLVLLRPLSCLYRRVVEQRRQVYLKNPGRVWQPPVPLIVVGNITLGGTGKTPMVIWLIERLQRQGLRVGVISRGYAAHPPGLPWLVRPAEDGPEQAGDEPLLIARRCGVPVMIDPDRARAGRYLLENQPVDVIISDDGLQHYRLGRTLELVMIDHGRGLGNRHCLPEGPLREPEERLRSVDFVVRNGAPADQAGAYAMALSPVALVNLVSGQRCELDDWRGERQVTAIAGIGHPERFFSTLKDLSFELEEHAFADHAHYSADSFAGFDTQRPLIMTEKDAVKCAAFARDNWWYLSVEASLSEAFAQALQSRLAAYLPNQ